MVDEDEERLKVVGDYKHGSIRRIRLTRFLTYSNVEIVPGPRLNMVVGPNGTGKSTILCAVCLGLGGEPILLGRASEIETFVMNGEDDGEIEIEVQNSEGDNPIIRRVLRRNEKPHSSFFWNDQPVSRKIVRQTCLEKFHISVDNLCTFLPQDRVGSFSGFDSKMLLLETEKSLSASQHLYKRHQELLEAQQELRGGNNQVETLQDKLQQLENEVQRYEREKQRMEERKAALEQAELLRKKLVWLQFDEARKHAVTKQGERKSLKLQHKEAMAGLAPLVEAYEEAQQKSDEVNQQWKTLDQEIQKHQKEMGKQMQKWETHDDSTEETLAYLNALDAQRGILERKAEEAQERLDKMLAMVEESPSEDILEQALREANEERRATQPLFDNAKKQVRELKGQIDEIQEHRQPAQEKSNKLKDEKARRNDRFFRSQPKLKQIHDWVQGNRNRFRKEVIGPVVCEIATKSRNAAAYLEQHVSNSTLTSFIVQDKQDYDLLYRSIRQEQKIPINIVMVDSIKPDQPRMYSDEKMQILKEQHGVVGYLDESFTAPDIICEVLKSGHSIHKVLVGTDQTQKSLDDKNLLGYLTESERGDGRLMGCCIFASEGSGSRKYTANISKYSKKAATRIDEVRPAKWLAPGVSEEEKQQVQQELEEYDQKLAEIQLDVEKAKSEMVEFQNEAAQALSRFKKAQQDMKDLKKLLSKVKTAEIKAQEAKAACEVDDEEEKNQKIGILNKRIKHSIVAVEAHAESYKKMMIATVKSSGARLNREKVMADERRLKEEKAQAEQSLNELTQSVQRAQKEYAEARKELENLKALADENAPLYDENGGDLPLKAQLEDLPVETMEEAQAALEEAEAKAESIVADANVMRQYEAKKQEMEETQAELDNVASSKEKRQNELQQKLKPWEQALDEAVAKVDAKFSRYMNELGCTGEIQLSKGSPSDDSEEDYGNFKDWGIEIRVSFRQNTKTQILSAQRHSGGERSVSTIMYLMALQDMMVAPFRCVDEINQGLDDRNERLVFKRIVENSCQPPGRGGYTDHAGQYFLITPKLLPNLYDMEAEQITVLFIFNGPYNFKNPQDWNLPNLIALRKRSIEAADDDDENTPNSQHSENAGEKTRGKRARASLAQEEKI